ncbi:hypothetical protein [Mucilaginibacter sp.]|uniref:hypothetical protein n=1 Tax=Mucilaginibacter sp. TaxID=1882438 RepID=UPI002ED6BF45
MITKEDLQQKYKKLSTDKLLEIINNKTNYTELAVAVAVEELSDRQVSEQDIYSYNIKREEKLNTFIERNVTEGLNFLMKIVFFFLFIPILTFAFKMNYRQYGFALKLRQSNYYSLTGFISLVIVVIALVAFNREVSDFTTLTIWMIFFIPAYLLDDFFNRQKLIKRMGRLLDVNGYSQDEETANEQKR